MQGKDPFLALLGLFILATTFFFCGKGVVTAPPPVASEDPATILPPASNIIEPPSSSPSIPPVSAPVGLNKKIDERLIGHSMMSRINGAPLLPEGEMLLNGVAAMLHEDPTVVFEVGGHTVNVGIGHEPEVLSEQRAQADTADASLQRIAADQLTPNWYRMSRLLAARPTEEWRWQEQRLEWFIGTEGEQP